MKIFYLAAFVLVAGMSSCKTTSTKSNASLASAGTGGTKLVTPPAGSKDNDLDVDAVVKYMKDIRQKFYEGSHSGFSKTLSGSYPTITDAESCMSNNPSYWSTLVQHFYCLHPSYDNVVPNVRGCFSVLANGRQVNGRGIYPEIFDYCMYQDYDAVEGRRPTFDKNTIIANKSAGNKVGVLKYMSDEEIEVFKYVIFTWYNPFAFKESDQQKVLDEFWGPGKYTVQTTGKAMHPDTAILPFMQQLEASGGEVNW